LLSNQLQQLPKEAAIINGTQTRGGDKKKEPLKGEKASAAYSSIYF